jgi:hypothetical protein
MNETITAKVMTAEGTTVLRRISRRRRLENGFTVGFANLGGERVRVEKAPRKRIWNQVA